MTSFVDPQIEVSPMIQRFLGCVILGSIPPEVAEAVDSIEEQEVPTGILFLMKIWWGRNRAEQALPDVIELLQGTIKDMLT